MTCSEAITKATPKSSKSEKLQSLDIKTTLSQLELSALENKVSRWIGYTGKMVDRKSGFLRAAVLSARGKLFDALTTISEPKALAKALTQVEYILAAISAFEDPRLRKKPAIQEYYYRLVSEVSGFNSATVEVGRTSKDITHFSMSGKFVTTLIQLHPLLTTVNSSLGAMILRDVAVAFRAALENQTIDSRAIYKGPQISWDLNKIGAVVENYNDKILQQTAFKSLESSLQSLEQQARKSIQGNIAIYGSARSNEILKVLVTLPWFKIQRRKVLYFLF